MKKTLPLLSLALGVLLLSGCGNTVSEISPSPNSGGSQEISGDVTSPQETITPSNSGDLVSWTITHPEYIIELLDEGDIPLLYEDFDQVYTITHTSNNRWSYLIVSEGSRSDFMNQRNFIIFQDHSGDMTGSLASNAFDSYTITDLDRYMVAAPIDWVLLISEVDGYSFVLDFDDPSGQKNTMNLKDIKEMLQYFEIQ